jgi:hypothetical protein
MSNTGHKVAGDSAPAFNERAMMNTNEMEVNFPFMVLRLPLISVLGNPNSRTNLPCVLCRVKCLDYHHHPHLRTQDGIVVSLSDTVIERQEGADQEH